MGKHAKTKENKNKNKNKKNNKHLGLKIFLLVIIILGIVGGIFAKKVYDLNGNWVAVLMGHDKHTLEHLDKLNILIMGEY